MLRNRLKDEEFDSDILTDFINESQFEILGEDKYKFLQKIDCFAADKSCQAQLPFDYQATAYLFVDNNGGRSEVKYVSADTFFKNNEDQTYTTYGDKLFYKVKDNARITHLYLAKPQKMVRNTDKAVIPYEYNEVLLLGALARAEEYRDNFDYAQLYRNQQDNLLTNMKLRYGPGQISMENVAKLNWR